MGNLIGGFLLAIALIAWLSISVFTSMAVVPRIRRRMEPHAAGLLVVPIFEAYYFTGICLQLLGVFGAISLVIAALVPAMALVAPYIAFTSLVLMLAMLGSTAYAWRVVLPAIRSAHVRAHDATDVQTRNKFAAQLRANHGIAVGIGALQIVACLIGLGLFVAAGSAPASSQTPVNHIVNPPATPGAAAIRPAQPTATPAPATAPAEPASPSAGTRDARPQ